MNKQEIIFNEELQDNDEFDVSDLGIKGIPVEEEDMNDVSDIELALLETDYYEEAEQVPLDDCTKKEQQVIIKYLNKIDLSEEDLDLLREVLGRYREGIHEVNPKEVLKNHDENMEYNKNEKKFLQLLRHQRKKDKSITMNYPLDDGTVYELKLKIKQVDSETVTDLQNNLGMFQDITQEENRIRSKQQQNIPLSREEQLIMDNLQRKLQEKVASNQEEIMLTFLSKQTTVIGEEYTEEELRELYSNMEYQYLEALFSRVSVLSGLNNPNVDDLFQ